jgi:hypothetical protein
VSIEDFARGRSVSILVVDGGVIVRSEQPPVDYDYCGNVVA